MDRRGGRSPPPPRDRARGGAGWPDGPGPRDHRRRSRSPDPRFNRGRASSPPPYSKRPRREDDPYFPRFNRGYDDFPPPPRGGGGPYYRDSPPRGGSPEREGPGGPDDPDARSAGPPRPLSFKQFLLKQRDDPSPDEAQARYREYLVDFHGSELRAEFEAVKHLERVRASHDPREAEAALAKRNAAAAESSAAVLADISEGKLDPTAPGFNQGALDLAPAQLQLPGAAAMDAEPADGAEGGEEKPAAAATTVVSAAKDSAPPATAPAFCWQPSRVAADLQLARRLVRRLNWEKGIDVQGHTIVPNTPSNAAAEEATAGAEPGPAAQQEDTRAFVTQPRKYSDPDEPLPALDASNYDAEIGALDLLLTYLWRVHGVDFYAGHELPASEFAQRLTACRLLRGPRPADVPAVAGEPGAGEGDNNEPAPGATDADRQALDAVWAARLAGGDPLEAKCQRQAVEDRLNEWVDAQVVKHDDKKWGSLVSSKQFVARKFVVKHILTKHEDKVAAAKAKIYDDLFWLSFKAAREAEERPGGGGGGPGRGRPGGRGPMGGGRGPRGRLGPPPPGMLLDPMGMMPPPMMMPGPGGGFLPVGMPMPLPLPMLPPAMLMGALRGGRGGGRGVGPGRGGGRGGRGGGGGSMREYFDLDHPHNNRAILDYGDL